MNFIPLQFRITRHPLPHLMLRAVLNYERISLILVNFLEILVRSKFDLANGRYKKCCILRSLYGNIYLISNGYKTKWSPIRSAIIRVITKSCGRPICLSQIGLDDTNIIGLLNCPITNCPKQLGKWISWKRSSLNPSQARKLQFFMIKSEIES